MVHSEAMGNLEAMERIANIALLIVGGNDTTRNSMSALVEAFDKYPDQLERLRADPSLIPNAAQEIIRWQSPVTHMRRTALEDTDLAGQMLREIARKDLADKPHAFAEMHDFAITDNHARTLLPPVLQGEKAVINGLCGVLHAVHRHHAAMITRHIL